MVEWFGLVLVGIGAYLAYVAPTVAEHLGSFVEDRGTSGVDVAVVRFAGALLATYGVFTLVFG